MTGPASRWRSEVDWTPARDRRLRAMWANPWEYTLDDIGASMGCDDATVSKRARQLGLPPRRPHELGRLPPGGGMAQYAAQRRAVKADCYRRAMLAQQVGSVRVVHLPNGARAVEPAVQALIDAALKGKRKGRGER